MAASMKKAIIKGRITRDIDLRYTQSGRAVCSFHVACDNGKDKNGQQYPADFIPVTAWGQTAEFLVKYFSKGSEVLIEGDLKTRSYEDDKGSKHFVMEVIAQKTVFCGGGKSSNSGSGTDAAFGGSGSSSDDDIPF